MAAVASQDNPLPLRPANPVPTMTSKGTDPADRFEQLLRQCENRAIPEAKAQEVVNRLDQVNLSHRLIADELANLVYSGWAGS